MNQSNSNQNYKWTPLYYPRLMQVKYYNVDTQDYKEGLAYHNFVINLDTGGRIWIPLIVDEARQAGVEMDDAIIEHDWKPLILAPEEHIWP